MINRSAIAKKAVRTLRARKELVQKFGTNVATVLTALAQGFSDQAILADKILKLSSGSLAAIKANLTRGTYEPFVKLQKNGRVVGTCNLTRFGR